LKNSKFSKVQIAPEEPNKQQELSRMFKKARPARPQAARSPRRTEKYVEGASREERLAQQ